MKASLDTTIAISIDDGDEDLSGPLVGAMTITVNPPPVVEPPAPPPEPPPVILPEEPLPETTAEEVPQETPAEETVNTADYILDADSGVSDRLASQIREEPTQSPFTASSDENENSGDRNRTPDNDSNKVTKAETVKPVGVEVLVQTLIHFFRI